MQSVPNWNTDSIPNLSGKSFVVTGANSGIGFATVKALAAKQATVFLGCRNDDRGKAAVEAVRTQYPQTNITAFRLDLASLSSVRNFAEELSGRMIRLDGLINNGGIMMAPFDHTEDGFEIQFGTNVLGHFALTGLLMPLLRNAPASRVVTLSSLAHWYSKIDFENLSGEKSYSPTMVYSQSKLANLVFAYELQRRLQRAGGGMISVGVHPGVTNSGLGRHAPWTEVVMHFYGQSIDQGALPSLRAATDSQIKGGDYVGPGGFMTFKGAPTVQRSSRLSHDPQLGERLWSVAQDMTGIRYL